MNSRASQLQPAVEQAKKRSDDSLAKMSAQQNQLAKAEQQLQELQRYRQEYALAGHGGLNVAALLNQQKFVDRIDQAIVQQGQEIQRLRRLLAQGRMHWQQAHARERALGSVIEQYRDRERRAEDRREQADADERSQYRRPRG